MRDLSGSTPRLASRQGSNSSGLLPVLALLAMLAALALFVIDAGNGMRSTLSGIVALPLLAIGVAPVISRVTRAEGWPELAPLLWLSFGLHAVAAVFRTRAAADSLEYNQVGATLADQFRRLEFSVDTGRPIPGTGTMRYLTGLVHVITGSHMFATLLVFATLAFLGTVLFMRAFSIALPDGDRRRYGALVLLWPSLLFWPSSIGKEAWIMLASGIACYGAARWFRHRRGGITLVVVGALATFMVRPHVALLLVIAIGVAFLFCTSTGGSGVKMVGKTIGIVALVVGGGIIAAQTAEFLNVENLGAGGIEQALDNTETRTGQGGSEFTPARVTNPVMYPWAAVTVLLRPFPFEARSAEALVTSLEGLALLGLIAMSGKRLLGLPRATLKLPYVAMSVTYAAMFVFAFSIVGNFGLLARQRTQLLPYVFVMLCIPAVGRRAVGTDNPAAAEPPLGAPRPPLPEREPRHRRAAPRLVSARARYTHREVQWRDNAVMAPRGRHTRGR